MPTNEPISLQETLNRKTKMTHDYKLGKIAGPSGTFSGYVLVVFGIISTIFTFSGIVVLIIGLYLAFGQFCSMIDSENRKLKMGIKLFGWAIPDRWTEIDDTYKLEIRKVKGKYTVYSSSNRKLELEQTDFKIFIYSTLYSRRMAIAKFKELDKAQNEIETIRELLKLKMTEE
jgi:hypothetical protein